MPSNFESSRGRRMLARRFSGLALATSLLWCAPVSAQAPVEDEATREARTLMTEGIGYYERKEWDKAYAAFSSAWRLKQHFSILGNLALAEVKIGKPSEAANHFSEYLRLLPRGRTQERGIAERHLEALRAELVALEIRVDVAGADIALNGRSIGTSPLPGTLFADPGQGTLEVRHPSYPANTEHFEGKAGEARIIDFDLQARRSALGELVPPTPVPRGLDEGAPRRASASVPSPSTAPESASPARTIVLGSGAALSGVAVGLGVLFALQADGAREDELALQRSIDRAYGARGCGVGPGAGSALCVEVREQGRERSDAASRARAAFVVAGVLGAATVAGYFAWPAPASRGSVTRVGITPGGVLLNGSF